MYDSTDQRMSFLLPPQGVLASRKELVKYDQKKMEMGPLITLSEPSTPAATPTMPIQLKVCTQHTVSVASLLVLHYCFCYLQ